MSGEDFFSRWSRRKREVRETERAEPRPPEPVQEAREAVEPSAEAGAEQAAPPEPELSAEALQELPSLEDLTPETDISVFFRKGVPQALRNAAMRRMWSLDPAIRDYVGDARDYAWDWNVPGDVPGYGPLASTDEIYATLDRMFSPHPAADAGREPGAERAVSLGHSVAPQHDEASVSTSEPAETAAEPAPSAALQQAAAESSTRFVAPEEHVRLTITDEGPDANVAAPQQAEPESPLARPRRHGGAAPV